MATPQTMSEEQARRLTDAFSVGIQLREQVRSEESLFAAVQTVHIDQETLSDGYPEWHPAPHPFLPMIRMFLYHEITGESYQSLSECPELATTLGLETPPAPSVLSRTWRNRFDEKTQEFIKTAAHFLVKEVHDRDDLTAPVVRPKSDITPANNEPEDRDDSGPGFSDEEIRRTTRLAREHTFGVFESDRAVNASYDDSQFFELQTFLG